MSPARPRHRPPPRGAVLPFVLVALTVLIGAAALAIDLGRMRATATEVQDVADASALAAVSATQFNPNSDSQFGPQRAQTIAALNRAAGKPGSVATADVAPVTYSQSAGTATPTTYFTNQANGVVVTARATPKYALAGALGWVKPTVARSATAWIGNMQGAACVRPLAVPYTRIYEDINTLTSKPYSSQSPPAYAPTITQVQVAQFAKLDPISRTFVTIPPWQKEEAIDTTDGGLPGPHPGHADAHPNSGSWHTTDYSGAADWAAYEGYISPPTGSSACAAAATSVGSYLYPFTWNVARDTGMAPTGPYANTNGILDHNRRGFLLLCNQYGGGDTTNHAATCRNADGTVGVSTRVAFTDSIPATSAGKTFSQRVRMVSQARIMCYFVYSTDRCPATVVSNGAGGQVSWSMPLGWVCTKRNSGNGDCINWNKQPVESGYPRGTMVVLLDSPVYGDITRDVTLGDSLSLTQRLVLVK